MNIFKRVRRRLTLDELMFRLRGVVYFFGGRPRPGTVWYSPSRASNLYMKEYSEGTAEGLRTRPIKLFLQPSLYSHIHEKFREQDKEK